ncbi:PREDICTED: transcription factor TRY-like [Nelumbo nucifera]|uniref:Transcription factor CPC-like n=2 Tax=Nelumbo nucifera TaxID=4432 RepID=A0A822YWM0_NELNU|nr:PREDICTED: transcription factor TRY-like [Nelumbo nucifera]DAD35911.1 TPA_asm: hypothetical protein HUJ06_006551 [Nelumbo nucifera]
MCRKTEVCCLISILSNVSASMLLAIGMLLNFQGAWPIWIAPLTIPLWILGVLFDVCIEETSQGSKLEFTEDEETLIARMYNLLGDRWSLIAGRIPGRTAEEIEKYWTSRYSTSE